MHLAFIRWTKLIVFLAARFGFFLWASCHWSEICEDIFCCTVHWLTPSSVYSFSNKCQARVLSLSVDKQCVTHISNTGYNLNYYSEYNTLEGYTWFSAFSLYCYIWCVVTEVCESSFAMCHSGIWNLLFTHIYSSWLVTVRRERLSGTLLMRGGWDIIGLSAKDTFL